MIAMAVVARKVITMTAADLLFAGIIALAASLPFPLTITWRLSFLLPAVVMLSLVLNRQRRQARARNVLHDYQALMAYLSSRLSVGETLERAFWTSESGLRGQIGRESPFAKGLKQIARQIDLHSDLGKAIQNFVDSQPCAPVQPVLLVLPVLQKMGGRLDQFVRDSHRMLAEMSALEQEIKAEQSQKQAEALILALMPFVLSAGLQQMFNSKDYVTLMTSWLSQLVYGGSYLLACLALTLTWAARQTGQIDQKKPAAAHDRHLQLVIGIERQLARIFSSFYERPFLVRYTRSILDALAEKQPDRERYFQSKLRLMALGAILIGLWISFGVVPNYIFPVGPFAACLLQDALLLRRQRSRINRYRIEYPLFLNWQVNLLRTGFTVANVMQTGLTAWSDHDPTSVVGDDLRYFQQQSRGVRTCDWIIEQLADRNPVPELQVFWHNIARYEREGGLELLDLLALQARTGYQLLSYGRRRELEERSLMVLLPMMIDLLVVLLISIWPSAMILIG